MENRLYFTGSRWVKDIKMGVCSAEASVMWLMCDFYGFDKGCTEKINGIYYITKPATP